MMCSCAEHCLTCAFSQCSVCCQPIWTAVFTFSPEQKVARTTMCAETFTETGSAVLLAPCRPMQLKSDHAVRAPTDIPVCFIPSTLTSNQCNLHRGVFTSVWCCSNNFKHHSASPTCGFRYLLVQVLMCGERMP